MKILKFGGTSVGSSQAIKQVMNIVIATHKKTPVAIVVSAFSGVTDQLIELSKMASRGDERYVDVLKTLEHQHLSVVKMLLGIKNQSSALANVKMMLNQLEDLLQGIFLIKELSLRTQDFIMSFGERLSAYIITEAFQSLGIKAEFLDAREVVKTNDHFGSALVDFPQTHQQIRQYFKKHTCLQIITGFIGSTSQQETTTLGRGGSDYTASIFGSALKVSAIEIWTDVDGVMTADPRKVKKAFPIQQMTYIEAMEMSYFGAKVIHPPTMQPALEADIPIWIKNTFNPKAIGTKISREALPADFSIRGISSIHESALLRFEGSGMVGVSGVSMRLFGALARKNINIILISQASSEHSICFAIAPEHLESAQQTIEEEFSLEISAHLLEKVKIEKNLSIIAIVGENMRKSSGVSGKIFQALGKNGINVVAIAQGSSELNISVVIDQANETKALNAIHDNFFLSDIKSFHIFQIGTGLIGGALLQKIDQQNKIYREKYRLELKVVGIADRKKMLFDAEGVVLSDWKKALKASPLTTDLPQFITKMKELNLPHCIFVDCTADEDVAGVYEKVLKANISIVTPNKKANASSLRTYQKLRDLALRHNVQFRYETTVGAGLPVISTLNDLIIGGDKILKIEAVISGTLSYIFNSFNGSKKFSEIVEEAQKKGYTEPDPRDDLNGMDVARKLLILGREMGLSLELKDIEVENFLSSQCQKAKTIELFFQELQKMDAIFEKKKTETRKAEKVFRYIAVLAHGKAKVSLQTIDREHPFYALSGSDNIVSFTTENYRATPLVIKGPGAGAGVTTAGVLADIIRISHYLM